MKRRRAVKRQPEIRSELLSALAAVDFEAAVGITARQEEAEKCDSPEGAPHDHE